MTSFSISKLFSVTMIASALALSACADKEAATTDAPADTATPAATDATTADTQAPTATDTAATDTAATTPTPTAAEMNHTGEEHANMDAQATDTTSTTTSTTTTTTTDSAAPADATATGSAAGTASDDMGEIAPVYVDNGEPAKDSKTN